MKPPAYGGTREAYRLRAFLDQLERKYRRHPFQGDGRRCLDCQYSRDSWLHEGERE